MNKLLKVLTSRIFLTAFLIIIQLSFLLMAIYKLSIRAEWIYVAFLVLSYLLVIYVFNIKNIDSAYQLAWIVILLALPVIGPVIYMILANKNLRKSYRLDSNEVKAKLKSHFNSSDELINNCQDYHMRQFNHYITDNLGYSAFNNTDCKYFGYGEDMFEQLFVDLQSAKHFILMEYFIVSPGVIWDKVLEILKQKASEGVVIKFIYDDFGTITTMDRNFKKDLLEHGIEAHCFNPIRPMLIGSMNYRDHRKICVIDNCIGYMGGINLADEYANKKVRFGRWKDSAIRIEGQAVWAYTVIYLQELEVIANTTIDYEWYKQFGCSKENNALVTCFADAPGDEENVGLICHLELTNNAQDYLYICAPYLLINQTLLNQLLYAAKRGVDVRIMTPHVPDKWYVHLVSQSFYEKLIKAGIKIYEYTPGFVHAKTWVSDDQISFVGSTNIDYRSYYLNFECNTLVNDKQFALSVKQDYLETLKQCQLIDISFCENKPVIVKILTALLAGLSPLF